MKLLYASRFTLLAFIAASALFLWQSSSGVAVRGVQIRRLGWIIENQTLWSLGWWLWMVTIFAWMWLLVTLAWAYLPAHRVQSMLQSGLMLIAAVLAIAGSLVWWTTLPVIAMQQTGAMQLAVVDSVALGFVGAGLLMAGIVTAWIGYDLWRQNHFPAAWVLLQIAAGVQIGVSPFLFPAYWHLIGALVCWLLWLGYLALRPKMPSAFAEWN